MMRENEIDSAADAGGKLTLAKREPIAWMRRWAFEGVDVMAIPKAQRPAGWLFHELTRHRCAPDDVPLYAKEDQE